MKKGILLLAHGTSRRGGNETSADKLYHELEAARPDCRIYQAYYGRLTLRRIDREAAKTPVNDIEAVMEQILSDGVRDLYVLPDILVPGPKMEGMRRSLEVYRDRFEHLCIGGPVFERPDFAGALTAMLRSVHDMDPDSSYFLVVHRIDDLLRPFYEEIIRSFQASGMTRVYLLAIKGEPDVEAAAAACLEERERGPVRICPLMFMEGNHFYKDVMEGERSIQERLKALGIEIERVLPAFGVFEEGRAIFRL